MDKVRVNTIQDNREGCEKGEVRIILPKLEESKYGKQSPNEPFRQIEAARNNAFEISQEIGRK